MKASQYNKNLPPFLHRTQKQLDEDAPQVRETSGYDENLIRFNRAVNEEILATDAIGMNARADKIFLDYQKTRIAESFLERGMFEQAYETHPDERIRDFYGRILEASKNSADCGCAYSRTVNEQRTDAPRNIVEISKYRLWRVVFDSAPEKLISIFVCNHCRQVKVEYATNQIS